MLRLNQRFPRGRYLALADLELKKFDERERALKAREEAERKASIQAKTEKSQTASVQHLSSVEQPDLKVGDRWVFRTVDLFKNEETSKWEQTVTGRKGDSVQFEMMTIASKTPADVGRISNRKADGSTWTFVDSRVTEGKQIALAFPLEVGKTWEYPYSLVWSGGTTVHKVTAKVEAWEDVQVPAGKFRTLRVAHTDFYVVRSNDGRTWRGNLSDILWYAPEVKRFVKREFLDRGAENLRHELTEYEVK